MQTDERQEDSPPDDSSTYRSEEWQVRLSGEPRRGKKVSKGERDQLCPELRMGWLKEDRELNNQFTKVEVWGRW